MQTISRDEARQRILNGQDVAVIEVLPEESFNQFHLPGARNVPVGDHFGEQIQRIVPNKDQPVIVYCKDTECGASPKAAKIMDELGYTQVFDYEAGKEDWKQAGLPTEP